MATLSGVLSTEVFEGEWGGDGERDAGWIVMVLYACVMCLDCNVQLPLKDGLHGRGASGSRPIRETWHV